MPTKAEQKPHQLEASGCLFTLFWVCVALGLIALAVFALASHLAASVGS